MAQKSIYSIIIFHPIYKTDERGNVVITGTDKMVYYKDNRFLLGYHSERKVWKTIKGAEKALLSLKRRYRLSLSVDSTYGIEDDKGSLIEWHDEKTNKFYKQN